MSPCSLIVRIIATMSWTIREPASRRAESRGSGHIVNVSSVGGFFPTPGAVPYIAAKHGVLGLTKTVALEVAQHGVTCNAICPGYVKTPLVEKQIADQAKAHGIPAEDVVRDVMLVHQARKEFVKVEELAALAVFLSSDAAAFVRGLRQSAGRALPVVVFAGTVGSADQVRALLALNVAGYVNEHAATPQILPALAPHLFPDNFNRRESPRVVLSVPVSYRAGQTIAGALTLNIGKGGLAIRTLSPLAPETHIEVKFRLPGNSVEITATARVAWSDRKVGMGVQFERLDPRDQAVIDTFVDEHHP